MYVHGNPVMYKDPTGHVGEEAFGNAIAKAPGDFLGLKGEGSGSTERTNEIIEGLKQQLLENLRPPNGSTASSTRERTSTITNSEGKAVTIKFSSDFSDRMKNYNNATPEDVINSLDAKLFGMVTDAMLKSNVKEVTITGVGRPPINAEGYHGINQAIDFTEVKFNDGSIEPGAGRNGQIDNPIENTKTLIQNIENNVKEFAPNSRAEFLNPYSMDKLNDGNNNGNWETKTNEGRTDLEVEHKNHFHIGYGG